MNKKLSVFSLSLITICSVDSIRNLPAAAMAGNQLFNYFILALIFFLLPCAIISAWFSQQSQQGVYGWIKQGLGQQAGFMAVWYQCVQNILIYPTLLSFIAGTLLYSISPDLVGNKRLLFLIIIFLIWSLTWVNLKGIQFSSRFNSFCSITGLLPPFIIIMAMGLYWGFTQTKSAQNLIPPATAYSWTSLTAIILSFCGIELAAVHAKESKTGAFPKAVFISVLVIFFSMLFGSITLAMIIPATQLNFISSIPELVQLFFTKMHCGHLAFIVNGLIAIGCMGAANNWLIAPIKGLGFAVQDGFLKPGLTDLNVNQTPAKLLILQALCVSLVSALFLIIPTINTSYWMMLNAATQINLLMYFLLFCSALRLIKVQRPPKAFLILIAAGFGLLGISMTLVVSFTPPPSLQFNSQLGYALAGGLFLMIVTLIPLWNKKPLNITRVVN